MRAINHLSVSALAEFIACPRKFRLHRIDRVLPTHRPVALAFGTAFHAAVGRAYFHHGRGEPVVREAVYQAFRDSLHHELQGRDVPVLFDDGEDEDKLVTHGIKMLDAFLDKVPMPDAVLAIEKRFEIELVDRESGEVLPVPLLGFIDIVAETAGRVQILELKTAARRWDQDKIAHDQQTTAYALALKAEGVEKPQLHLLVTTKTRQPDVQSEILVRTDADENELVQTALSVHRAIEAGVDHPLRSWACKTCAYAEACR